LEKSQQIELMKLERWCIGSLVCNVAHVSNTELHFVHVEKWCMWS